MTLKGLIYLSHNPSNRAPATLDIHAGASGLFNKLDMSEPAKKLTRFMQVLTLNIVESIKRWGPKNIISKKRILSGRKEYSGEINLNIDRSFVIAVSKFYKNYISMCKDKQLKGLMCETFILRKSDLKAPVGSVFYELAEGDLKKEAGSLRINE